MDIKTYSFMMNHLNTVMQEVYHAKNALTDEFMNTNMDTPYDTVLLALAKVDKISAIKFHRDAKELDLRSAKDEVDALLANQR